MRLLLILILVLAVVRCASPAATEVPPDIEEAAAGTPAAGTPAADGAPPPAETAPPATDTNEADLQAGQTADTGQPPPPPTEAAPDQNVPPPPSGDLNAQAAPPPPMENSSPNEAAPPPAEVAPPPPTESTSVGSEGTGEPASVTGLDYKSNLNGGTIVLRTDKPITYTTRKNEKTNQFIIDLKNTAVPKRFRQPYTTKEFPGAIASINAYQSKGSREGHVVVQLRDNVEPGVTQDGNIISISGGGGGDGSSTPEPTVENNTPPPPREEIKQEAAAEPPAAEAQSPEDEESTEGHPSVSDKKVLASHTLADFLTGSTKFYGRPISIEVRDNDVRDVLRFISEETGLNLVVGDDVSGKITLKLRQIPWDQALSIVLQSKQLGYVKQGNVLRIASLKTLQSESDAARSVIDAQRQLEPLHVQVFPISYAKAVDLEAQAKDFLSPRGKAKADTRTNNLVVTDIDENLSRIRQLVKRLDTQTPEVLIEAKVVEARESFQRIVGVNWNFSGDTLPVGVNSNNSSPVTFQPNLNSGISASNFLQAGFTMSNMDIFGNLTATLQLLESESLVKVISAPRIVTLDRVEANIQQTTQFPIFSSTVGPTGQAIASVTFQDVKLELDVTPQITMDGSIIMTVKVTREFPDAATQVGTSSARSINKRSASTQVLVENGDTVVIGGIYQSDVTDGQVGVPWLSKIPLIGALFRQKAFTKEKNELVIFLTPRTLNREKAFLKGDTKLEGGT